MRLLGLGSGFFIGFVTVYFITFEKPYTFVREIPETQMQSAAAGIMYGFALGYLPAIIPVLSLGNTVFVAHTLCVVCGVALGALGMLSTQTVGLAVDAFGPISKNAFGPSSQRSSSGTAQPDYDNCI